MTFNRNEFVSAFALALDFLESSFRENVTNHNKRVALIALKLGKELKLSDEDLFDLYAGAMLHDNGITHPVYNKLLTSETALERSASHCIIGEENLKVFPFLKPRDGIILYHHESYDGSGYFAVSGNAIPLFAHIICMADALELLYSGGTERKTIIQNIASWKGSRFSPVLCDAFEAISSHTAFWLSLENLLIEDQLERIVPFCRMEMSLQDLVPIAGIFSKLIDEKSPFTGKHSRGIAEKSEVMANFYHFDEERKTKLILAAHLHDAGKLAVPNTILDKDGGLTAEEFEKIKPHVFYTRYMLERIQGFEDITEWAGNHHEKLDGSGYPYGLTAAELGFESRLMACIDIYQALTEERPYRKPLSDQEVSRIMFGMAGKNAIDRNLTADVIAANQK